MEEVDLHDRLETMLDEHDRGGERYAAFGLRMKQLFLSKAKLAGAKAQVGLAKAKAAAASSARYTRTGAPGSRAFTGGK